MIYDCDTLESQSPHYLASVDAYSASFVDLSTGECFYFLEEEAERYQKEMAKGASSITSLEQLPSSLRNVLSILPVAELVQPSSWNKKKGEGEKEKEKGSLGRLAQNQKDQKDQRGLTCTYFDPVNPLGFLEVLEPQQKAQLQALLCCQGAGAGHLNQRQGSGQSPSQGRNFGMLPETACRLFSYVVEVGGKDKLFNLKPFYKRDFLHHMCLNANTLKHLEILEDYRGKNLGACMGPFAVQKPLLELGFCDNGFLFRFKVKTGLKSV